MCKSLRLNYSSWNKHMNAVLHILLMVSQLIRTNENKVSLHEPVYSI